MVCGSGGGGGSGRRFSRSTYSSIRSFSTHGGRRAVRATALIFSRQSHAHANTQSERGRPNNNSAVFVGWRRSASSSSHSLSLLSGPDLINIPPWWAPPLDPPVLIRSWNLWRTHIRDARPICVPVRPCALCHPLPSLYFTLKTHPLALVLNTNVFPNYFPYAINLFIYIYK